jgi:hypothetical protein
VTVLPLLFATQLWVPSKAIPPGAVPAVNGGLKARHIGEENADLRDG